MPTLAELVRADRSTRRFLQEPRVTEALLLEFVDLARIGHSGANAQPLRYALVSTIEACECVFPYLRWAAALPEWNGPEPDERPTGYVVICRDRDVRVAGGQDQGIAAEVISLAATERGYAACMIGAFDAIGLSKALDLDDRYQPLLVVALGAPGEQVVLETVGEDGRTGYWRDAEGVHHVPKRALHQIVLSLSLVR